MSLVGIYIDLASKSITSPYHVKAKKHFKYIDFSVP